MGTLVVLTTRGGDPVAARAALESSFREIARLEALLSEWQAGSEISALNRAAGGAAVQISPETEAVLRLARRVAELSGGAFDPTVLPLLRYFGLFPDSPVASQERDFGALRALVGWRDLQIQPGRARLARPGMELGLGGIAKGYIADRALEVLRRAGLEAGLVNAGGDLAAFDLRGVGFPVGIERPGHPGEWLAEGLLREGGLATSASTYGRHILDPRTGRFASGNLSSTVLASSAALADAWATAFQVLGDVAEERVASLPGIEAILIGAEGRRWVSAGLAGVFHWVPQRGEPGVVEGPEDQEEHRRVEDERTGKLRPDE